MTFPQLCEVVGDSILGPTLVLYFTGLIGLKRVRFLGCIAFAMFTLKNAAIGHQFIATLNGLFSFWYYWLWKNGKDDDDGPKRKRQALRSKFDKVLPKPVTAPAPQVG